MSNQKQEFILTTESNWTDFKQTEFYKQWDAKLKPDFKKEILQMLKLANQLNFKYTTFPLFHVKIVIKQDKFTASLCFKDFSIANTEIAILENRILYFHYFYFYAHSKTNYADLISYLHLIPNAYNDTYHMLYNTELITTFYSFGNPVFVHMTGLDDLLSQDLTNLILLVLNPFNDLQLLKTNKSYLSSYFYNTTKQYMLIKRNQANFYDMSTSSLNPIAIPTMLNEKSETSLKWKITKDERFYLKDVMNYEVAPLYYTLTYLNYLCHFHNLTYNNDIINILNDFAYNKLDLDTISKQTQTLDTSNGLKHGSDLRYFFNISDLITNDDFSSYQLDYLWRNHNNDKILYYNDKIPYQPVLYHTITLKDHNNAHQVFHISLNYDDQLNVLQQINKQITYRASNSVYDEITANTNQTLLKQGVIKNLNKLPIFFSNKTIYTKKKLTFNPNPMSLNANYSQAFLTINPMLNPTANVFNQFNNHFDNNNKQEEDTYSNQAMLHQGTNYIQVACRSSLMPALFSAFKQHNVDFVTSLFYFYVLTGYLKQFFQEYILYHNKFGYIYQTINGSLLLYGNVCLPSYQSNKEAIDDLQVIDAYSRYDEFLTKFYQLITDKAFITAFLDLVKNNNLMQDQKLYKLYSKTQKQANAYNFDPSTLNELKNSTDFKDSSLLYNRIIFDLLANTDWFKDCIQKFEDYFIAKHQERKNAIANAQHAHTNNSTISDLILDFLKDKLLAMFTFKPMSDYETYLQDLQDNQQNEIKQLAKYTNDKNSRL